MRQTARFTTKIALILWGWPLATYAAQPGGAPQAPAPTELPRLLPVKDRVFLIQNVNHVVPEIGAFGGNITIYLTDEGVILIDSKNERMHDDIVAKVRSLTPLPIKYVILTHNHGDHSGGSLKMQQIGATVLSSRASREHMVRANLPGQAQVTYSQQAGLHLGGRELQLRELRGHTRGDTVIYFPAERVLVAGDLVTTPDSIPGIVNYGDGGNWTEWGESLDAIAQMDFDILIAGHGPTLTKPQFLAFRDKIAGIRERFRALNRERKSADEIGQTLVREYNWGGPGPAVGNIAGMMQELR